MSFTSDTRELRRCARNSYRDEFFDFTPRPYSHASPRTSSHGLSRFSHGPNHRSYGFGSRENNFVPRSFDYGPHPRPGDCFPRRHGFPAGGSYTHFEPRHLDGLCFLHHGSRPTGSKGEEQKTIKICSGRMVKCWITMIYLTNSSTESLSSSRLI
jgi:hypothetical protein